MTLRGLTALATGIVCLVISGCETSPISRTGSWHTSEPITPSSYRVSRERVDRSVGKLRRMAVLQIEQAAHQTCGGSRDPVPNLLPADEELREFLAHRRGYEVIVPDPEHDAEWLTPPESAAVLQEVMRWPSAVEEFVAGSATKGLLEYLRRARQVDSLLVLRAQTTCDNADPASRAVIDIVTLGMHEVWPEQHMVQKYKVYRVAVFETSSGRVVWQVGQTANDKSFDLWLGLLGKKAAQTTMERLFESLEPATPGILAH